MTDMLVKLYDIPDPAPRLRGLERLGIGVRRPMAYEKSIVLSWVSETFGQGWADECGAAFTRRPVSCFVTVNEGAVLGFACYDCTYMGFFGPAGVQKNDRGRGIGTALLLTALKAMAAEGYAYAIIGYVSSTSFYERAVGATVIEDSGTRAYPPKLETD
jgi:GNAT superfamily N-acetyltransferase